MQVYVLKEKVKANIPEDIFTVLPDIPSVGFDLEVRVHHVSQSVRMFSPDFWLQARVVLSEPAGAVDLSQYHAL